MIGASNALPSFVPATARSDRYARSEPVGRRDDAQDASQQTERTSRNAQSQFALLLALLGSAGPTVRADVLKTLPPDSASLIDRLLDGVGDATGEPAIDGTVTSTALASGVGVHAARGVQGNLGQLMDAGALDARTASMAATDAMRYALMQDASRGRTSPFGEDGVTAASLLAASDSRSMLELSSSGIGRDDAALRALSRIAGKRSASREQLLALGDEQGAQMQAALDALLSHAGTAEGAMLANSSNAAAIAAAAAALVAANAASAADVTTPVRDPNALAPELRARLDRVIARMRDEYGSDVSIVETARSQERQDFLYAQGRTRQGPVVTWTQDSAHTRGEAVDVLVDGSWNNAVGFARLQRIAREEGLRTLGVKDPGHLELMRDGRHHDASAQLSSMIEGRTIRGQAVAATSVGASVARVASVASVASVARVGMPGDSMEPAPLPANVVTSAYTQGSALASRSGNGASGDTNDSAGREANSGANGGTKSRSARVAPSDRGNAEQTFTAMSAGATAPSSSGDAQPTAAQAGVRAADRVAAAQALQDGAGPASLSRMTLDIDGPNGMERITVDLRGNVVDTHITTDSDSAARLRAHSGELQDALGRQGLTSDSVRISSSARLDPNATRTVAGERESVAMAQGAVANGGTDNQANSQGSMRDRGMAREWEKNEDARKARDEQQRGAGQRGQRGTYNEDPR